MRDDEGHPVAVVDARQCDSKDHEPRLATVLLHWVTGPIDYCQSCAEKMLGIAAVLGTHCHTEPIAPPELPTTVRAIDFSLGKAQ